MDKYSTTTTRYLVILGGHWNSEEVLSVLLLLSDAPMAQSLLEQLYYIIFLYSFTMQLA